MTTCECDNHGEQRAISYGPYRKHQRVNAPSQVGCENIYKMYKNKCHCVIVLQLVSYHGLHTESEMTGGATGEM